MAIVNHVVRTHTGRLTIRDGNVDLGRFAVIITLPVKETKTPDIPLKIGLEHPQRLHRCQN